MIRSRWRAGLLVTLLLVALPMPLAAEGTQHAPSEVVFLAEIIALQEKVSAEVFAAQVGKHERVLVHGPSKRDPAQLMGRTDGFKTVILPSGVGAIGELVDVTIARATMATLFGATS